MDSKASSRMITILGVAQAVGTALADFLVHTPMDGGALHQPTFYIGLVIAAAMGLKAYYTQGTPSSGQVVVTKIDPDAPRT